MAGFLLMTVAAGLAMGGVRTNNSFKTWLPEKDPVIRFYHEVESHFASHSLDIVLLDMGDVFTAESFEILEKISGEIENLEGVDRVLSLANVIDIRLEGEAIQVGKLTDRLQEGREVKWEAVRQAALSSDLYNGFLVSHDGRYATIMAHLESGYDDLITTRNVDRLLKEMDLSVRSYLGGDPAYAYYSDVYTMKDMRRLLPLALLGMFLVFVVGFKKIKWTPFPIGVAVLSIVWLYGLKSATGGFMNILTPGVMLILLVTASDYTVYTVNFVAQEGTIRGFLRTLGKPVLFSCLTTVAGFLSFGTTGIWVMRDFGVSISIGLVFGMFCCLLLMPALWGGKRFTPVAASRHGAGWTRLVGALMPALISRPWSVLAVAAVIGAMVIPQVRNIQTRTSLSEYLPAGSPPIEAGDILSEKFAGSYPLLFYFKGDLADPIVLRAMTRAENYLRSLPEAGGVMSTASLLGRMRYLFTGEYGLPQTARETHAYYFFLEGDEYAESLVSAEKDRGLVVGYLRAQDTQAISGIATKFDRFLETIQQPWVEVDVSRLDPSRREAVRLAAFPWLGQEREWLAHSPPGEDRDRRLAAIGREEEGDTFRVPHGVVRDALDGAAWRSAGFEVVQTGYPALTRRLEQLLVRSQREGIAIASLAVFILVAISMRSLKFAGVAMVPVLLPLGLVLGSMGWTGMPLDFGTVLLGGIILGLGIDGAIHFLTSVKERMGAGRSYEEAVVRTAQTVGRSFLIATASTLLGFLVLAFSSMKIVRNLALTCGAGILLVLLSVYLVLPPLMAVVFRHQSRQA